MKWTLDLGPSAKLENGRSVMIDGANHDQCVRCRVGLAGKGGGQFDSRGAGLRGRNRCGASGPKT
jgi:hypothetical protein